MFNIILDSGAFSAWTKKTVIDIDTYIAFIKKHLNTIDIAIALDVIPGSPNIPLTMQDRKDAAKQSWKNYKYMIKQGIPEEKVMPVFHQGEDEKWLKRMIKNCEYIGVSPANDKTTNQRINWLKNICNPHILESDGKAKVKFHGFAVTSFKLMQYIPWYSVDSSTWKVSAGRGSIILPKDLSNQSFKKGFFTFSISSKEKKEERKNLLFDVPSKREFDILPSYKKKLIINFIELNNYDLEKLRENMKERYAWNVRMFNQIEKYVYPIIHFASVDSPALEAVIKEKAKNILITNQFVNDKFIGKLKNANK